MATDANNSGTVNQVPVQSQETKKNDQEINFAALRKKTEALEAQLQEKDQLFKQQQTLLEQIQNKFQPPRDEFDAIPDGEIIDKATLKRIREKDRETMLKEAEQVARQTYAKIDNENFAVKLHHAYPDYDEIVNETNAARLQEKDPAFMRLLSREKDEFVRREEAYKRMKQLAQQDAKPTVKAQEIVEENRRAAGNFFTPSGQGPMNNPYAFEFDVRNPQARQQAYQKLKAAQKRG